MNSFGSNLKNLRKEKKLSQKALAQTVGVGQTTIANYENDQRYPNPLILSKLADALDVSLDLLLERERQGVSVSSELVLDEKVFVDLICSFKDDQAMNMVLDEVKKGYSVLDLYYNFFKPVMYHVGDLWEKGRLSIPMEHHITYVIDKLLILLSDYIKCDPLNGKKAIFIAPGSENHLLGLKIVKETFRQGGWKTFYIGKSVPWAGLVDWVNEVSIDLVVISTTIENNLNQIQALVDFINKRQVLKSY
jgi:methanogenic corrinoid protein MtbC1